MSTLNRLTIWILILILFVGCRASIPPQIPQVDLQQIESAFLEGNWDEVINYCEKGLKAETDNVVLRFVLSIAYYMKGKYDLQKKQRLLALKNEEGKDAIVAWCERLAQKYPHNHYSYLLLGSAYRTKDQIGEALGSYKRAIGINPNFADAYLGLGTIYYENGQVDKAIQNLKKAVDINPGHMAAHYNLGLIYEFNDQIDKAIAWYEKTVEIDSGFIEAYVWLGDLYLEKGNQDKALKAYKKVIELDPNSELGLYALDGIDRAKEYLDEDAENTDAEKTP